VRKHWQFRAFSFIIELPPFTVAQAPDPELRIATLERELAWAHLKIQALIAELRQQRIQFLGPRSETLSDLQLELLADEEPGATRDEVEAESQREPIATCLRASASRIRAGSDYRKICGAWKK
jgi:hypothetical protein